MVPEEHSAVICQRGWGVVIRKWLPLVLLAGFFAQAAWLHFVTMPLTPIADKDTWGYLSPAVSVFTNGYFKQSHRSFVYPGFLSMVLRVWQDFSGVIFAQGALALLGGGFLWMAWRKFGRFLPERLLENGLHTGLGLLMMAGYLLSMRHIELVHTLRPEAVFPAFASLQLWITLSGIEAFYVTRKVWTMFWTGLLMVVNAGLLYMLKPEYGFALAFSALPLVLALRTPGAGRRVACACLPLSAVLVFALFFSPQKRLTQAFRPNATPFLPKVLFSLHAKQIYPQLLRQAETATDSRVFLEALCAELKAVLDRPSKEGFCPYPTLGFDPDQIMYRSPIPKMLEKNFGGGPGAAAFCYRAYFDAWIHQPLAMSFKILRELGWVYGFDASPTGCLRGSHSLQPKFAESFALIHDAGKGKSAAELARWPVFQRYADSVQALSQGAPVVRQASWVSLILRGIDRTFFPLLCIFLGGCVAVLFSPRLRSATAGFVVSPMALGGMLVLFNFGMTLTGSVAHSMKVGRYIQVQFAFTLFSYFALLLIVIAVGGEFLRLRKAQG
jgi:hypothetical protein